MLNRKLRFCLRFSHRGERRMGSGTTKVACRFLSTLSSRRATAGLPGRVDGHWDFYPRSPRGERRQQHPQGGKGARDFYPRSPRGERLQACGRFPFGYQFLSTLSSRRATFLRLCKKFKVIISIHALLAESDVKVYRYIVAETYFYPRSPRGERPGPSGHILMLLQFLSTLSSRRATRVRR